MRQETEWEQLKNERQRIQMQLIENQQVIKREKKKIEEDRIGEADEFKADQETMRQFVENEVS